MTSQPASATMPSTSAGALRRFQDGFARVLLDSDAAQAHDLDPDIAALAGQPAFAVYRNTVIKGCVDALHANYPVVARLVGDEWFGAAAAIYARGNLPTHPALVHYGAGFADFLAEFAPAAELPYLPGVARLDRFWTEAHTARDEPCIAASVLRRVRADELPRVSLRPHASARWAWFDALPIFTIWRRNRTEGSVDTTEFAWRGEGALVLRPQGDVVWSSLDAAACALLDTCAAGGSVVEAGAAALAADPAIDPASLFTGLFATGVFARMDVRAECVEGGIP